VLILALAAGLLVVNGAAFALFWIDKRAAATRGRRIPERRLLRVAALGGAIGAFAAQQMLRHKTRKQPFAARLALILGLQVCGLIVLILVAGLNMAKSLP
jgi:uncharacterized membrane protein YsdA (DUF1294 family)